MKHISSRQHPTVRIYRDLARTPTPDGARLLLDGAHLIAEAAAAGLTFESVAIATARLDDVCEEHRLAVELDRQGVVVIAAAERVFAAMTPVRTPSGIVAIVNRSPTTVASICGATDLFVLIACDVQDPGNLGGLLRVAEAAGMTGVVVCGESANPFSWKAVRGSMGSVLRLPTARSSDVEPVLHAVRQRQATTAAAVPRGGLDPDAVTWARPVALLIGGEGAGLDAGVAAGCDLRVTVPMAPPVESLNVTVAGAILAFAARRGLQ